MFHVAFVMMRNGFELGASSEWEFQFLLRVFSVIAMVAKTFLFDACCDRQRVLCVGALPWNIIRASLSACEETAKRMMTTSYDSMEPECYF